MKKRLALLLVCVMCIGMVFSGCNLFAMDTVKYLAQPVATIEYKSDSGSNTVTITKKELVETYRRNAENLSQSGYTGQAAVDYLVEYLINQKVMLNETQNLITANKITVTNKDLNNVYQQTYDSMISLIADYESQVIEDWKYDIPSSLTEEQSTATVFEQYQPKAKISKDANGYYIEVLDNTDQTDKNQALKFTKTTQANLVSDITTQVVSDINTKVNGNAIVKEALKRYYADLKNYEQGQNLSTIDAEVWNREVSRVCKNILENKYLSLYQTYLQGTEHKSTLSVNDIFKYLENKISGSYTKYTNNIDTYKTDLLSTRANVSYFISDSSLGEYFNVSHILVKFSDEQTAFLKALEEQKNAGGLSESDYNTARENCINSTKVKINGETQNTYTAENLLSDLTADLNGKDDSQKLSIFNTYNYKYNEDTGNKNAEYDYIVGTNDSKMVESFTENARELYNNGQGKLGDISTKLIESEYGVHILFYIKPLENTFNISDINTFSLTSASGTILDSYVTKITTEKLSAFNTKTLFDQIYDTLASDNFTVLESLQLDVLKSDKAKIQITTYNHNYKDLY